MTEWGARPTLLASLVCEDVATSRGVDDGRVTIQRVFFGLSAARFPARYDRLVVVNVWTGSPGTYKNRVRIVAPDATLVAEGETEFSIGDAGVKRIEVVFFHELALPEAGEYVVIVSADDTVAGHYTLRVEGEDADQQEPG
jgi:hypothetical protein